MDIFDGFWDNVNQGVYEHIRGKWIKAFNLVPFATLWEWSLQSFATVFVIAISPQLARIGLLQGWLIATASYFTIWLFSTTYEFYRTVPRRWKMEEEVLQKAGLELKYRRRMAIR
jgi:type VI protein secretion system component VasK